MALKVGVCLAFVRFWVDPQHRVQDRYSEQVFDPLLTLVQY